MQRERTIPKSRAVPAANNPLDPYNCGYLRTRPKPNANLAKLAIDVAPEEIKAEVNYLSHELGYATFKSNNLLLYGKSGTGKTTLAQAIAIESGHPYSFVSCCYLGDDNNASDNLYRIVNYAREQKQKPYIIILDDMDNFWQENPTPDRAHTLRCLLKRYHDDPAIYFIGVATTPQLNSYLGAFFNFIKIPLPNQEAREKALTYNINAMRPEIFFQYSPQYIRRLSEKSEHFCFPYLQFLVFEASLNASDRERNHTAAVTEADFEKAFHDNQKVRKRLGLLPKTVLDHVQEHPYCAIAAGTATAGALIILAHHFKKS